MAAPRTIKIDVVSDFLCAWCYIGHIDLERGMALAHSRGLPVQFAVQYHPLMLCASLPEDHAISKEEYYVRKNGSLDKAYEKFDLVRTRAKEVGIQISFTGNTRQTTRAHRLLQKAYIVGGQRAQCALLRRLFRAYFEEQLDIGDPVTLAKLSSSLESPFPPRDNVRSENTPEITITKTEAEASADVHADDGAAAIFDSEDEARAWVEGTELEKEVRAMSADAARKGVAGVPFTVIDSRWALSGSQKPECYYKIFEKLATPDTLQHVHHKSDGIQRICTPGASCTAAV